MKVVLITGGSRGIGRSMVRKFAEAGWDVAFTYFKSADCAEELEKTCGAFAIKADSACEDDINNAVTAVVARFGRIDCLINNAGISHFSLFTDVTLAEWNRVISVDLTAAFLYSKAVIPDMLSRKEGRIINISSVWGIHGSSMEVCYSTAKAGLIGMTKALAKELGPSSITVNAIAPGVIKTDMNNCLSEDDLKALEDSTALMRLGSADEIADAALFLAGDGAGFITGEVLGVSGGFPL